jgi:protein TonB
VGSPAAIVLGERSPTRNGVIASCAIATLALYGALGFALSHAEWPPIEQAPPIMPELELFEHSIELPPPPVPEPPPPVSPPRPLPPPPSIERAPPTPAPEPPPRAEPPPPAAAADVVAQAPTAEEPLDFTRFTIGTGKAERYAGGVTASSGTNTVAVHSRQVDRDAAPGNTAGFVSLAKPVRLAASDWRCPWPEQADLLAIDEERVLLRVNVDAEGAVTQASVLEDPGHGFGRAALECARRNRFLPALDASGRPIAATSPPIRVRFTR